MIRINLLPFRAARKKENIRRQVSVFFLSLLFITIATIYYHNSLKNKIVGLNERIKDTKIELDKYDKINKEIADIKKKRKVLKKKMDVIKGLDIKRREPIELLDIMTRMVIPERLWFTNLDLVKSAVKIKGISLDNQTVADFMTRLESTKLFSSVNLKTLKEKELKKKKILLKMFIIECKKKVTPQKTDKKKTKKIKSAKKTKK